jgi:hypothetical protein
VHADPPHAGKAEAYRRHLVIYDGRHMYDSDSEPVAFSLTMPETGTLTDEPVEWTR